MTDDQPNLNIPDEAPQADETPPAEAEDPPVEKVTPVEEASLVDETPKTATADEASPTTPMPRAAKPDNEENEILTEQFHNYLRIGQALMKTLKRPKDLEICSTLIAKCQKYNDSSYVEVKRNNNSFFRYCLRVIKWTSDNQPLELYERLYPPYDEVQPVTESRTWLEDNKSYMAFKYLKDGTQIIYAAVAEDPLAGWQEGGLNILAKRGTDCSREIS